MNKIKISLVSCEIELTSNGLRSISSQLKKYYYETKIVFLPRFNEPYTEKILRNLYEVVKDSELIGFYCMSRSSKNTIHVIKYLKSKGCTQPFITGGIYATLNPDECLKYADVACVGEGEEAMLELVRAIEKNKDITKIKNLWVKKDGKIYRNEIRPLIENINKLPFEDYDLRNHYILIDSKIVSMTPDHMAYGMHNLSNEFLSTQKGGFITLHTIRGCPYDCAYCCNYDLKRMYSNKGKYVRARDTKNVISELTKLKNEIPRLGFVWFTDDDFLIRTKEEIEYFGKSYKEKIGLPFMCYVAPVTLSEDKLKILISSGLSRVEMGIQTGSERLNKQLYNRNISQDVIINASKILSKEWHWNPPEYQFICANPFETKEGVLETIKLIQKLPTPFYLRIFNLTFFPGSYMYKKAVSSNIIKDEDDGCADLMYCNSVGHLGIKKMSKDLLYLSSLLNLMQGDCSRLRYGRIPKFLLKPLINNRVMKRLKDYSWLLVRLLKFTPYGLIFWKLPYKVKSLYIKIYSSVYREVYVTFKKAIVMLKYKYRQLKALY